MEKYDYRAAIMQDILNYIHDNDVDWHDGFTLYDILFEEDSVTGNGYNFYDSEDNCAEYLCHNLDLYLEAAREFDSFPTGTTKWIYEHPARTADATIRCYLLGECLDAALKHLEDENGATEV